jgi:heme A synthase
MNSKLLLRIAAGLMLLHTIGHTIGALTWNQAPNAAIGRVITAMETNHFDFMGRNTTIASFYSGYGIIMIFVLLLLSLILWLLSNESENRLTFRLLLPLTVYLILQAITELLYFFPFAAAISFLAGIAVLLAWLAARKTINQKSLIKAG